MFGSMTTGLAYEYSDLDLALRGLLIYNQDGIYYSIEKLNELLKNDPWIISSQPIPTAHIPIIKLVYIL